MANGVEKLLPYRKFGYAIDGNKKPDPNSIRSKARDAASRKGKGEDGLQNNTKGGKADANPPAVI